MSRWSLDFRYAGRSFIFTDQIDVQLSEEFPIFSGVVAEVTEVSLELDLGIDVPAQVEAGRDLSGSEGSLSLDGTVALVGRAIDPSYGDPTEPAGLVRFTLRESVIDDTSLIPEPAAKVDADTWPDHDPNVRERVYPEVFGAPGDGVGPGSPGYYVQISQPGPPAADYLLIAGHEVLALSVTVHNLTQDWAEVADVAHVQDGLGRSVAVVDLADLAGAAFDEGDEFWVEWTGGDARSGAAGDVLAHYMARSTLRLDTGRISTAQGELNRYLLGGYFDERINPMEWIADNLLPILPLTLARNVGGLFPLVFRSSVTAADATAHLVAGPDCVPTSPVTYEGSPLTELLLAYQLRADTDERLKVAIADETNNFYAAVARARYRGDAHDGRYGEEIETDIVYDPATAARIVAEILKRRAFRVRVVEYRLDREVWAERVNAGDLVTITDPDRAWTAKPAWITSRTDDQVGMDVALMLQDDPPRDPR